MSSSTEASAGRTPPAGVRRRVLVPLVAAVVGLVATFGYALYHAEEEFTDTECRSSFARLPEALEAMLDREAAGLSTALEAIVADRSLAALLGAEDREALLAATREMYAGMHKSNSVTHMYFLRPDRRCLLRVHQPRRFGDRIDRFTALRAERTGRTAAGIEMGPLGTFTLRVVRPWRREGRLVGYVELGKEIDGILARLGRDLGLEFYVVIHKRYLDRARWEDGMRMLGRRERWDRFPESVLVCHTLKAVPQQIAQMIARGRHPHGPAKVEARLGGRSYRVTFHELEDAGGREVGDLVALRDVTAASAALRRTAGVVGAVCLLVGAGLVGFFFLLLGRVDRTLARQTEGLRTANERLEAENSRRAAAEATARKRSAQLGSMISSMDEGVVFADADGDIVEANEWFCRCAGAAREQLLGRKIAGVFDGSLRGLIVEATDTFRTRPDAAAFSHEIRLGGADLIVRLQPIYCEGRYDGILLNLIDVSELVAARRQAEAASRAKSTFLANVSHEIRTPLTAVLGYAELLESSGLSPEQRQEYIRLIRQNGIQLLGVINDVLDLARIEAGRLELSWGRCDVGAVARDVVAMLRGQAEAKQLALHYEPADLPGAVLGDELRLRQVLMNLVGNAIKFTETGSVSVACRFVPGPPARPGTIRIDVADTGIGMAPEVLARVGRPFEQGETDPTRRFGGSGLGLAISRRILDAMGGTMEIRSRPGEGSTFTLRIPARVLPPEPGAPKAPAREGPTDTADAGALAGLRVLLAEDTLVNQRLISAMLRRAGADVVAVDNGRQALEKALGERFDAVLMDMQMPEMDGYEATRRLRQAGCTVPVLALTAHAMASDRAACIEAGCTDYLSKPITSGELVGALLRHGGAVATR